MSRLIAHLTDEERAGYIKMEFNEIFDLVKKIIKDICILFQVDKSKTKLYSDRAKKS